MSAAASVQPARRIPVIGIVGGVGSGKSSVARALAKLCPVAIIDADRIGHTVLEIPEVKDQLRNRFGHTILDEQGHVVRPRLAGFVFGNTTAAVSARTALEQITHPEIARRAQQQILEHQADGNFQYIVLDAALLLEAGWSRLCDCVVFVEVHADKRAEHVEQQRGWTRTEWQRREASQWPVAQKRAAADLVISNDGTLERSAETLRAELALRFPGSNSQPEGDHIGGPSLP